MSARESFRGARTGLGWAALPSLHGRVSLGRSGVFLVPGATAERVTCVDLRSRAVGRYRRRMGPRRNSVNRLERGWPPCSAPDTRRRASSRATKEALHARNAPSAMASAITASRGGRPSPICPARNRRTPAPQVRVVVLVAPAVPASHRAILPQSAGGGKAQPQDRRRAVPPGTVRRAARVAPAGWDPAGGRRGVPAVDPPAGP